MKNTLAALATFAASEIKKAATDAGATNFEIVLLVDDSTQTHVATTMPRDKSEKLIINLAAQLINNSKTKSEQS